ncbi:MAG TPA: hypothetical protein VFJ16_31735 [Longimicrobium sp.]|nr:hypothetical protein [Longimicrobium sp.]
MTPTPIRRALALLAGTVLLAACGEDPAAPQPDPNRGTDSFDTNTLASYAPYSDAAPAPSWAVAGGELVGTGVANQAVLVRTGASFVNGYVEATSVRADDGGLVLRFVSPTNYYLLAFRDDSAEAPRGQQNLALYHHDGMAYNQMWTADVSWARGTQHVIRLEASGNLLRVYFDGALKAEITPGTAVNDPNPSVAAGGVGVRHFGFAPTWVTRVQSFTWHSYDTL